MTRVALAARAALAALAAVSLSAVAVSCASVPADARIGIDAPSDSTKQWGPVGAFIAHRCGTLDCHGQAGRNFQVWGCEGMRLDPKDIPQCQRLLGGRDTTPQELEATYRSLVGLEPVVMSVVYDGNGQHPELLTFVRKARGIETHKGGALMSPGDYQDNCITSWLQGKSGPGTDPMQCASALNFPQMPMDASAE
jgi:hypothetical protein